MSMLRPRFKTLTFSAKLRIELRAFLRNEKLSLKEVKLDRTWKRRMAGSKSRSMAVKRALKSGCRTRKATSLDLQQFLTLQNSQRTPRFTSLTKTRKWSSRI